MSSELDECEVERRLDRLREAYGAFDVREETVENDPDYSAGRAGPSAGVPLSSAKRGSSERAPTVSRRTE